MRTVLETLRCGFVDITNGLPSVGSIDDPNYQFRLDHSRKTMDALTRAHVITVEKLKEVRLLARINKACIAVRQSKPAYDRGWDPIVEIFQVENLDKLMNDGWNTLLLFVREVKQKGRLEWLELPWKKRGVFKEVHWNERKMKYRRFFGVWSNYHEIEKCGKLIAC